MAAEKESGEVGAARRLHPELKSSSPLREMLSRFRQPGDLVFDFLTGTVSTVLACVMGAQPPSACYVQSRSGVLSYGEGSSGGTVSKSCSQC